MALGHALCEDHAADPGRQSFLRSGVPTASLRNPTSLKSLSPFRPEGSVPVWFLEGCQTFPVPVSKNHTESPVMCTCHWGAWLMSEGSDMGAGREAFGRVVHLEGRMRVEGLFLPFPPGELGQALSLNEPHLLHL